MAAFEFTTYVTQINAEIRKAAQSWLEEAGGELEAQAARNTRVDTGKTKGAWTHRVDSGALEAIVGNPEQNAIWEEYGTGLYAENGGRTDVPWRYKAKDGKWYATKGKHGTRAFRNAYNTMKPKLIKSAQAKFQAIS